MSSTRTADAPSEAGSEKAAADEVAEAADENNPILSKSTENEVQGVDEGEAQHARQVRTITAILGWFALNVSIVSVNKWVISREGFQYPAILTNVHMVCSHIFSAITLSTCLPSSRPEPSPETLAKVRRLSLAFCGSVFCGNMALQYLYVSFAQMISAAGPLVTLVLSKVLLKKSYSHLAYLSMVPMCAGVMLCVKGEVNFSPIGLALIIVAITLRAVKSIVQGMLLTSEDDRMDPLMLLKHMSKYAIVLLTAYAAAKGELWRAYKDESVQTLRVFLVVTASGFIAFGLNLCNFLVTKYTSAVTLQVLGNVNVVLSILLSLAVFGNEVTLTSVVGCALTLSGVALYNKGTRT